MHDTCTVFSGHIVSGDDLEGITALRLEPRNQLMVPDTYELGTLELAFEHLVRHELVARLVLIKTKLGSLRVEPCADESLCHDVDRLLA